MGHLSIRNLGKSYKRYHSRWGRLREWIVPGAATAHKLIWVLRNIDFQVAPGESVGIIGRNGAGKSTLLKLVMGTSAASEGEVRVGGRMAGLLELGMGFHPDFTGRQNARIAGQLLGMSGEEVDSRMPEIEAFAEIGSYIDEPVRTYSSGMQVRLAFSISTAVQPEILVIDEALAVGDAYFQHKCFDRIRHYRQAGMTLLFVSHDPGAVKLLCDRAILLENGLMVRDGDPNEVLDYYNATLSGAAGQAEGIESGPVNDRLGRAGFRSGNRKARIEAVLLDGSADTTPALAIGAPLAIEVRIVRNEEVDEHTFTIGIMIKDRLGIEVFGTNTHCLAAELGHIAAGRETAFEFKITELNLGPGSYSVTVALHRAESHISESYDWWDHAAVFEILPAPGLPDFVGLCRLPLHFSRKA
ncbi:MAG: ABC transporter ATP-binding protein [Sterolibacterium sp.]|nr:ABC transporter ATP-binding protein [Sterolibacterium sp.]